MSCPRASSNAWSYAGRPSSRRLDRSRWPQHVDDRHYHGRGADDDRGGVRLALSFGHYQLRCFLAVTSNEAGASHRGKVNGVIASANRIARQRAALHAQLHTYNHGLCRPPGRLCFLREGFPVRTHMTAGTQIVTARCCANARWVVLCLLLGLTTLGFLATPASSNVPAVSVQLISTPAGGHSDCDGGHLDASGHCHTTTACFAYAQATAASVSLELRTSGHPKALSQDHLTSRTLQPNLRPPKRSIQA
jgi:hypothetical protein